MVSPPVHGTPAALAPPHVAALPAPPAAHVPAPAPAHARARPAAKQAAAHGSDAHWDYTGPAGPQTWGGLKPEFSLCGNGQRQSPIDIRGGLSVDLEPVRFDYQSSRFSVIDNGHTVQANLAPGNAIEINGNRFELQQFHFHRPSEERIDGRQFEMSVHLVHKDPQGKLAVVTLLLEKGPAQPAVQKVWNNLPLEKNQDVPGACGAGPERNPARRSALLHLHGLAHHAALYRRCAVGGDAPAGDGGGRADRAVCAHLPDERAAGAAGLGRRIMQSN
jgi:hypothetical protein